MLIYPNFISWDARGVFTRLENLRRLRNERRCVRMTNTITKWNLEICLPLEEMSSKTGLFSNKVRKV
jgi:hypothetical protein